MNDPAAQDDQLADAPTSVSLREALGAPGDPDFVLALPPGWARRPVDDAEAAKLVQGVKERLMREHRPDLFGQVKGQLERGFQAMATEGVVAYFAPQPDAPDSSFLPASFTARIVHSPPSGTVEDLVVEAIRTRGATALGGDRRFVRFQQESRMREGGEQAAVTTVVYLTPIPGTGRSRALQLTLVVYRGVEFAADDAALQLILRLFDACVSTLQWQRLVA